ncbi:MAG TPA: glycosyltransferase family 87 protein [Candidatus Cloacimonadota bacterium]|nr:glycosyltransferase family 87 protein [Candidatus Cloacimonadota bacterium]
MTTEKYLKYFLLILLIYSIFIAFMGIANDTFYTIKYGGIDLRNRVVGVRNLLAENDPYYTKWTNETPDYFLDGRDYFAGLPVSRCTVTPSLLLMHAPFAAIFYKTQQYIWFALQESMLLLCIFLLAKAAGDKCKLVLIIGFMFFAGSYFWRFHVANGQIYILFVFMILLAYLAASGKGKYSELLAGLILGITATWRPPLLLFALPFLVFRKWKLLGGGIAGVLVGVAGSLLLADFTTWRNYFSAMKIIGLFHIGLIEFKLDIHDHFNNTEGMRNTFFSADVPGTDTSIQGMVYKFFKYGIDSQILWLGLIIVLLILGLSLWRKRQSDPPMALIFYQGTLLVLLSEFFLPAARLSYSNVIWLFLLGMIIIMAKDGKKLLNFALIFLLIAFAANYLYNLYPKSIMIADYCMLVYFLWMWFDCWKWLPNRQNGN